MSADLRENAQYASAVASYCGPVSNDFVRAKAQSDHAMEIGIIRSQIFAISRLCANKKSYAESGAS